MGSDWDLMLVLAQADGGKAWWQYVVEQAFGLTILFIFVVALLSVLFKQWHRDKCLKLLHGFHVCYTSTAGRVVWGDLTVYSKGIELRFDAPYRSGPEVVKTSVLIYPTQMPECLALCRDVRGLSADAKQKRERQIRRSFRPGPLRRTWRWSQNLVNTFRDAFSKSLSAFIGQVAKHKQEGVVAQQQEGVVEIGDTLLGVAGNAYEPILERHIGQPVVLDLNGPAGATSDSVELPGYLVDYTDKYLAVFNVEHDGLGEEEVVVSDRVEKPGYTAELVDGRLRLACLGPEFLCVLSIKAGQHYSEPGVVLPHGAALELKLPGADQLTVTVERTRRVDVVCPRSQATIRFGGAYSEADQRTKRRIAEKEHGIAPESDG